MRTNSRPFACDNRRTAIFLITLGIIVTLALIALIVGAIIWNVTYGPPMTI